MTNNRETISDEEKSYNDWVSNHLSYIYEHKQSIHIMRKLYIDGFKAGFEHSQKLQSDLWLSK